MGQDVLIDLFHKVTNEKEFMKQIKNGFVFYIVANTDDGSVGFYNILHNTGKATIVDEPHILATDALRYIHTHLSH